MSIPWIRIVGHIFAANTYIVLQLYCLLHKNYNRKKWKRPRKLDKAMQTRAGNAVHSVVVSLSPTRLYSPRRNGFHFEHLRQVY